MAANFFSNTDPELPKIKLNLPPIKKRLPKLEMKGESDLLFEIDGKNVPMEDIAERLSKVYYNS